MKTTEVLIVGAGIIGLGAGWRLVQAGREVTILERDTAGSGASTAAAGMLAPTGEVKFEELELLALGRKSLEMWPDFAAELQDATGVDIDYRDHGTIVVGLDRDDLASIDHLHAYHAELGLDVTRLSTEAMRELEPGIVPSAHGGLLIPSDHQVDTLLVMEALKTAFVQAGGTLIEGTEVDEILHDGTMATGVLAADDEWRCSTLIVAAGAWSRGLKGLEGENRPYVRPVRGQMISVELGEPPLCTHVIRAPDAYLIPKTSGRLIIGATMEEMGFDERLTAGGVFELLRGAWETLPGVYDASIIDMWTGFRPISLDNLPIIKRGGLNNLVIATGHGRGGILLAPITAQKVADLVMGGG